MSLPADDYDYRMPPDACSMHPCALSCLSARHPHPPAMFHGPCLPHRRRRLRRPRRRGADIPAAAKRLQSAGRGARVCRFLSQFGAITTCSATGESVQTSGVDIDASTARPPPPQPPPDPLSRLLVRREGACIGGVLSGMAPKEL